MTIKATVSKVILNLESLCASYENDPLINLKDIEETVTYLSHEVQALDIASDQTLKTDLNKLQDALLKLSNVLKQQQDNIERRVQKIHLQQRALYAYARVANNNIGTLNYRNI